MESYSMGKGARLTHWVRSVDGRLDSKAICGHSYRTIIVGGAKVNSVSCTTCQKKIEEISLQGLL